jgi:hypothetical protein
MNEQTSPIVPYELPPGHPLAAEWATYCRELPRLLAGGEEGRWALVQGNDVVSIWDTFADAVQAGDERFGLTPFLVHQIRGEERPVRITRLFHE